MLLYLYLHMLCIELFISPRDNFWQRCVQKKSCRIKFSFLYFGKILLNNSLNSHYTLVCTCLFENIIIFVCVHLFFVTGKN